MNMRDGYTAVMQAVAQAWTLPPVRTVSQWADAHRVLHNGTSAEPGQWRTDRNPLLREPMDALSDHHPATMVTTMACSQDGKSEILNNWIGYTIDDAPSSMLMVQPDGTAAERYSKKRIQPMIDACKTLAAKVSDAGSRDGGNTILDKDFPGGFLQMTGAGSASALASTPIKKIGLDEVDKFPANVQGQGSGIKQAEQRRVTFPRSKQYNSSTPIKMPLDDVDAVGGSEIWRFYQAGSRARYHVPCPHCGFLQELFFKHLRWEKSEDARGVKTHRPETAVYMCQGPECGQAIEEHHKPDMLADVPMGGLARWVHERPWITDHLSYHWNALYTPIGLGRSWAKIAEEWLTACRDRSKLVTFWNLILGLPFDDHADRLSEQDLEEQAEDYPLRVVPRGYFILTAAVDTQTDHLDFLVRAWGRNERSVVIDRVKIWKDPEGDEAWTELTKLRHQTFTNACGVPLRIAMTAVDTGGNHTQRVYKYAAQQRHDSVIGVKGSSIRKSVILAKPMRREAKNSRGDISRHGSALWMVGTDTAKESLFHRLTDWHDEACIADKTLRMVRLSKRLGPDFFRELTAEIFNEQTGLWDKLRERNEALDLMVYSHAAACHPSVRVDKLSGADWDYLQSMLEADTPDLFMAAAAAEANARQTAEPGAVQAFANSGHPAADAAAAPVPAAVPAPVATIRDPQPAADWLGDDTSTWLAD